MDPKTGPNDPRFLPMINVSVRHMRRSILGFYGSVWPLCVIADQQVGLNVDCLTHISSGGITNRTYALKTMFLRRGNPSNLVESGTRTARFRCLTSFCGFCYGHLVLIAPRWYLGRRLAMWLQHTATTGRKMASLPAAHTRRYSHQDRVRAEWLTH